MVHREPRNERPVCEAVAGFLAERQAERIIAIEPADTVVRDRPAVEAIYCTATTRFALEHTRIESFANQIAEGKRFAQLLGPLESELEGKLPGAFFLIVEVGTARVPAAEHDAVREALVRWIMQNAATLDPEERTGPRGNCDLSATPPGVPFQVTLHRDCDYESRLFVMQALSGQLPELRREAIARSLARKCPKLQAAREAGCVSVLILESDDISLANRAAIAEAVAADLALRQDAPNIVIWARTSTAPWKGALIKDGTAIWPQIDGRLFLLHGQAA